MVKVHTKEKRYLKMQGRSGRNRAARPKTFKTEDAAKEYAKKNDIKKFELVALSPTKIKVVVQE